MSEVAEFQSALNGIEEAYRGGLKAFVKHFVAEWQMNREEWVKSYAEPPPSDEWFTGFNAGVESADMALAVFLDECLP